MNDITVSIWEIVVLIGGSGFTGAMIAALILERRWR